MNIQKELEPTWEKICRATNVEGNLGTSMQDYLEETIRPLCPNGVGYYFDWNMSGMARHIFYEIANTENRLVF